MKNKRPQNFKMTIKRLLKYMGRHKLILLVVAILVILSALANLLGIYFLQPIIDKYTTDEYFNDLWKMLVLEGAIYLTGVLSTLGYSQIMAVKNKFLIN